MLLLPRALRREILEGSSSIRVPVSYVALASPGWTRLVVLLRFAQVSETGYGVHLEWMSGQGIGDRESEIVVNAENVFMMGGFMSV